MQIYMHINIDTYILANIHTNLSHKHNYAYTCIHSHLLYIQAFIHTQIQICNFSHRFSGTQNYIHSHLHIHTLRSYIQVYLPIYTHTGIPAFNPHVMYMYIPMYKLLYIRHSCTKCLVETVIN